MKTKTVKVPRYIFWKKSLLYPSFSEEGNLFREVAFWEVVQNVLFQTSLFPREKYSEMVVVEYPRMFEHSYHSTSHFGKNQNVDRYRDYPEKQKTEAYKSRHRKRRHKPNTTKAFSYHTISGEIQPN